MEISNNTVVSLRYIMKDNKGEIVEDNTNGESIQYVHGSGNILPALEKSLDGLVTGQTTVVTVSDENLRRSFCFNVVIDSVRMANAMEIKTGKPLQRVANKECGSGCDC
ncbi:MAG: FKBP-type peptidyl-prolyl cis-trans isomerase [Ferruginibacter sp.]